MVIAIYIAQSQHLSKFSLKRGVDFINIALVNL